MIDKVKKMDKATILILKAKFLQNICRETRLCLMLLTFFPIPFMYDIT